MGNVVPFPAKQQGILGVVRPGSDPCVLQILFERPVEDGELINTWLHLKDFVPNPERPEGWEPLDKSNPEDWTSV